MDRFQKFLGVVVGPALAAKRRKGAVMAVLCPLTPVLTVPVVTPCRSAASDWLR